MENACEALQMEIEFLQMVHSFNLTCIIMAGGGEIDSIILHIKYFFINSVLSGRQIYQLYRQLSVFPIIYMSLLLLEAVCCSKVLAGKIGSPIFLLVGDSQILDQSLFSSQVILPIYFQCSHAIHCSGQTFNSAWNTVSEPFSPC